MAKKNLPENIENKIAFFNGSMICFGYLNGKTEYLLPRPHDRKSLGQWSLSDVKLASSMNDGVVEEYFAEPLDEHYIKIKRTLNRKAPKLLDVFQLHNFLVLSKKAKAIVDEFENSVHQFSKLEFVSRDGGVIPGEYFAMIPLRFIKMQEVNQDLPNIVEYFEQPSPSDSMVYDYLFNISEHAEIRSYLLDKGGWSMCRVPELIFMSGRLISKLKECDCTGLKKFTRVEKLAKERLFIMSEEIQVTMDFSGSLTREMDLAFEETNDWRFDRQHYGTSSGSLNSQAQHLIPLLLL